jgi:hypothetical protein
MRLERMSMLPGAAKTTVGSRRRLALQMAQSLCLSQVA